MASGVGKNGKDAVFGFVDNFFGPDPRLRQMAYGRRLLAALPPMGRLGEEDQALDWLAELAAGH